MWIKMCAVNLTNDNLSKRHQVIKVIKMLRSCFWVLDKLQLINYSSLYKKYTIWFVISYDFFFFQMKVRVEWMKMYLSLCVLFAVSVIAYEVYSWPKGKKNNKTKQTDDAFLKQTCVAIWFFINAFSVFILVLCFMHRDECVSDNGPWHEV